ncbi:VOC family protein [Nonomuraea sp. NPDC050556]|uniref:VOC family protein n=1 Tax=Nonomuraea sp. NPDC050556 TaxID=3364369 RepID=UPI0037B8CB7D
MLNPAPQVVIIPQQEPRHVSSTIFISLPVRDPEASGAFFTRIGFAPDADFTGGDVVSMLVGGGIHVFLVAEASFRRATGRAVADPGRCAEVELAVQVESRARVDAIADAALAAGGAAAGGRDEPGIVFRRGFRDLDGHLWAVVHMG